MCKEKKNAESLYKAWIIPIKQNLPPDAKDKFWELLYNIQYWKLCVGSYSISHLSIFNKYSIKQSEEMLTHETFKKIFFHLKVA